MSMASPMMTAMNMANQSPRPFEKETNGMAEEIPIQLTLGEMTLSLGAAGHWELDSHTTFKQTEERMKVLEKRNATLEDENIALQDKCTRMMEECNMEKFKCQLLVEMLAVSSLDEERMRMQAEQEKARATSLKTDLVALIEQARMKGLDLRKLNATKSLEGAP
ncbi:hypothetical protein KXD40_001179 [Peronospora effusa]|uniref:Uncharacterized protein n=1 Tax=Peronospora effusa TaxID=542832 RepID=A0A3M6VHK9_9STRA|nr:hypothetical protein DD238_005720 [Peronospora effusa]RQM14553.1 hypothetical protein DD237_006201 [Peronospora effusa]UIZ21515.1 hypothetical protein KXD40_001179 [Peronospora effusa]